MIIDKKTYRIKEVITDLLFNDVHYVHLLDNTLYVAVTGLDAVFVYDLISRERKVINVLGKDPFHRFSAEENLNKRTSLKPHEAHPNNLFEIQDEMCVTRLVQKNAVCLHDISRKIDIEVGLPQDGIVKGGLVYFTTVNGYVVVCDTQDEYKTTKIKLRRNTGNDNIILGWCRGLFVDESHFYVGFTQLITTKITENLDWVKATIGEK